MVRVIRAIVRDRLALRICTVVNNAAGTVVFDQIQICQIDNRLIRYGFRKKCAEFL